jgi:hypothetical protein
MKPIKFKCPYGNHDALLYSRTFAGCTFHGRLLYTDIPAEALRRLKHKSHGWKTISDVLAKGTTKIKDRIMIVLKRA